MWCHLDKPWKYTKSNKSDTKSHILCDTIYMRYSEYVNPQKQKSRLVVGWNRLEQGEKGNDCIMDKKISSWDKKNILVVAAL